MPQAMSSTPEEVREKLLKARADVVTVYGLASLDATAAKLCDIAAKAGVAPGRFAVDVSLEAGRQGEELLAIQFAAAACEIAEPLTPEERAACARGLFENQGENND